MEKIEYLRELVEAVQRGDKERVKDLKDILNGDAFEPKSFLDLLKYQNQIEPRKEKRLIPTDWYLNEWLPFTEKVQKLALEKMSDDTLEEMEEAFDEDEVFHPEQLSETAKNDYLKCIQSAENELNNN